MDTVIIITEGACSVWEQAAWESMWADINLSHIYLMAEINPLFGQHEGTNNRCLSVSLPLLPSRVSAECSFLFFLPSNNFISD